MRLAGRNGRHCIEKWMNTAPQNLSLPEAGGAWGHRPADTWQGRIDDPSDPLASRWHQAVVPWRRRVIEPASPGALDIYFIGMASDEGVRRNQGRAGAAAAPA